MEYIRIKKIDDNFKELASAELKALSELWGGKKEQLKDSDEYSQFLKKMQREWAIETGIIERLYSWDRGITESLIEHGIDASKISYTGGINRQEADNISNIINDQKQTIEGLFDFVKGDQPFSEHFIRSMHEQFVAHQDTVEAQTPDGVIMQVPLLKGKYKEYPNNPKKSDGVTHSYCPPEFVVDEMENLIRLYNQYATSDIAPEVLSAWLHHRFTQIHPFQDGNGRIARSIATLVFLKAGLFPLVIRESDRKVYLNALEKADNNDIGDLVKLFAKRQKDCILSALNIQQQVEKSHFAGQIFANGLNLLKAKHSRQKKEVTKVHILADTLQEVLMGKLDGFEQQFDEDLIENNHKHGSKLSKAKKDSTTNYYFRNEIIEIAKKHDYYADTKHYKSWVRLVITTDNIFEIVFSIHGFGHSDNGVMAVSGFTFEKNTSEDGVLGVINTKSAQQDIFVFNYLEEEDQVKKRFKDWFDESFVIALAEWQQTIA
ncbi:Huntingtin interacting protein HYPE homolog [hydrothermal vent metagenome]|uniref:Huntingtin interacting protein HYPE homolog n=1 Tax=hydrothermal vent metagenome TaxID=652676 RepID=A0A1W1E016_9ZZZZ